MEESRGIGEGYPISGSRGCIVLLSRLVVRSENSTEANEGNEGEPLLIR